MKTKIKSHGDEVTDFYDRKIPKVDSNHTCLIVISLDSAFKKDDNCYRQVFLKRDKYIEKKVIRYISDNLNDFSSSDESVEEKIKAIRLIIFDGTILRMYFLRGQLKDNFLFNTSFFNKSLFKLCF